MKMLDKKEIILDLVQKKRVIILNEEITANMSRDFGTAMVWLNAQSEEEIKIIIDCNGGGANAGLDMYDMIKFSSAPVTGIVYSRASSMASVILQACKKRLALPHSRILIHYLRMNEIPFNEMEENFEEAIKTARGQQDGINEIYQKATGKSLEEIKSAMKADKSMTAQEALEFGLIDEIISSYKI